MMTSEGIDKIAESLAKAQGQMDIATKKTINPHFKSKYADLAAVWEACRDALSKQGLSVVQPISLTEAGLVVTTMLLHSSGQWIKSECVIPLQQRSPQAVGSAATYGRRYALAAMVGVAADDDDDGEAAHGRYATAQQAPAYTDLAMDFLADIEGAKDADALKSIGDKVKESPLQGKTLDDVRAAWKRKLISLQQAPVGDAVKV